ncbi:MAG: tol-pal system protein YbgF [Candidatus Thiodiazotropha sp.]
MMKIPTSKRIAVGLLGLLISTTVLCAENGTQTTEQRLERLERMMRSQNLADLVYQVQLLKQEVQRLNGELELQKHAMDAMNKRQRDLYLDIDQRLSRLQPGAAGSLAGLPPAVPAAPVTPAPLQPPAAQPAQTQAQAPVAAATPPPSSPPDPKQEAGAYEKAFNLLKQGRYKESIAAFKQFLATYSGGNYEDNAQYWLGEASYVNRDFDNALSDFNKVLTNYPQSSKVPGAMLKMGYIYYEQQAWDKARDILQRLQTDYPSSTEARLGEKRLERITKEGH